MQIGFDVGATKIESVILKDNGEEVDRSRRDCPKDYISIIQTDCCGHYAIDCADFCACFICTALSRRRFVTWRSEGLEYVA